MKICRCEIAMEEDMSLCCGKREDGSGRLHSNRRREGFTMDVRLLLASVCDHSSLVLDDLAVLAELGLQHPDRDDDSTSTSSRGRDGDQLPGVACSELVHLLVHAGRVVQSVRCWKSEGGCSRLGGVNQITHNGVGLRVHSLNVGRVESFHICRVAGATSQYDIVHTWSI